MIAGAREHGAGFDAGARNLPLQHAATSGRPVILVTGFDPFGRPGAPLPDEAWNPSGAAVLRLHGQVLDSGCELFGAVLPVSYARFATGLVEALLERIPNLVGAISVSMGRMKPGEPCRVERYVVGVHQRAPLHLHPSLPVEEHVPGWYRIPRGPGQAEWSAPILTARGLPAALVGAGRLADVGEAIDVESDGALCTLDPAASASLARTAAWADAESVRVSGEPLDDPADLRGGPGGWFLSNEVSYRLIRALEARPGSHLPGQQLPGQQLPGQAFSFHVHTPHGGSRFESETVEQVTASVVRTVRALVDAASREQELSRA